MKLKSLNKSYIKELENKIEEDNCLIISNIIDYIKDIEINELSSAYGLFNRNNLIGVIDLGEYNDGLIINNITIFKKYRGKNYGKKIIEYAIKEETGGNFKGKLYADVLHEGIIKFYEKLGFKKVEGLMYVKEYQ